MVSHPLRAGALGVIFGLLSVWPAGAATLDWAGRAFGAQARQPRVGGPVRIEDLSALRDTGPISVSPDGRWLAFSVRQAVLDENRYVLRWFITAVDGQTSPAPVDDRDGEPLIDFMYGLPYASVTPERARWSPDGAWIAYRRRSGTHVGLAIAQRSTGATRQVDDGVVDVDAFGWLANGALAFRTGLDVGAFEAETADEAKGGWLLDDRMPLFAAREPSPTRPDCRTSSSPACRRLTFVATEHGRRPATETEAAELRLLLEPLKPKPSAPGLEVRLAAAGSRRAPAAWAETLNAATGRATAPVLRVASRRGATTVCEDAACRGPFLRELGVAEELGSIWFVKSVSGQGRPDDAPRDETAVFLWRPGQSAPRQVLRRDAVVEDCQASGHELICAQEAATQPRRIIAIDLRNGAARVLADPNPLFAGKDYPRIRKLHLSDASGHVAFAHVVYPLNHDPRRRYPLVVTQYDSRGFLRAQVGGEHPIFDYSAHGMFVLSVDRPEDWEGLRTLDTVENYRRGLGPDLADRASAFQANEAAVDLLIGEGLVDPGRVGVTGVSAGAENVHYTLQTSSRYAAAIADSGSHDLSFMSLVPAGPRRKTLQRMFSMSSLASVEGDALSKLAWSNKPTRLTTPLLIAAGANQALVGFEGFQALSEAGRPLEVRIFPGEMHIPYRPQTIVAMQRLNRAWLRYWLDGVEDPEADWPGQYDRWRRMRLKLATEGPAGTASAPSRPGSTSPSSDK